jgi:hypothetical protein
MLLHISGKLIWEECNHLFCWKVSFLACLHSQLLGRCWSGYETYLFVADGLLLTRKLLNQWLLVTKFTLSLRKSTESYSLLLQNIWVVTDRIYYIDICEHISGKLIWEECNHLFCWKVSFLACLHSQLLGRCWSGYETYLFVAVVCFIAISKEQMNIPVHNSKNVIEHNKPHLKNGNELSACSIMLSCERLEYM